MKSVPYDIAFPDALGRLMSNLIQFELGIRIALHLQEGVPLPTETLRDLNAGDRLPENFLTNWNTLGVLIDEYNERESLRGGTTIDRGIVDLRDALAHGRMLALTPISEFRLIRFKRPVQGMVEVERVDTLTLEWLKQQMQRVARALDGIFARIAELRRDQQNNPG